MFIICTSADEQAPMENRYLWKRIGIHPFIDEQSSGPTFGGILS